MSHATQNQLGFNITAVQHSLTAVMETLICMGANLLSNRGLVFFDT